MNITDSSQVSEGQSALSLSMMWVTADTVILVVPASLGSAWCSFGAVLCCAVPHAGMWGEVGTIWAHAAGMPVQVAIGSSFTFSQLRPGFPESSLWCVVVWLRITTCNRHTCMWRPLVTWHGRRSLVLLCWLARCLAGWSNVWRGWHTARVSCVHATHVSPIRTQHRGMLHLGLR